MPKIDSDVAMTLPLEIEYTLKEGQVKHLRVYWTCHSGPGIYALYLEMTQWLPESERARLIEEILEYERSE